MSRCEHVAMALYVLGSLCFLTGTLLVWVSKTR